MKEFFKVLRRFVPPYKKYLILSVVFTLLSAVLNVFSFMLLIPILQILFKVTEPVEVDFIAWSTMNSDNAKEVLMNNLQYYMNDFVADHGESLMLLLLGVFLIFMTLLKTASYFASSAAIIPLRTGLVRDLRSMMYDKVVSLPLSFFSKEKKGDIIARMTGDVVEVENSIVTSLDMLIKKILELLLIKRKCYSLSGPSR